MPSEARLIKKKYRTIKRGPKKLNFWASKPGVRGARAPRAPLDPLVYCTMQVFPLVQRQIPIPLLKYIS